MSTKHFKFKIDVELGEKARLKNRISWKKILKKRLKVIVSQNTNFGNLSQEMFINEELINMIKTFTNYFKNVVI